jgi:putative hydrolase of the HAD superfamily
MNNKINTLIFDFGGVLISNDDRGIVDDSKEIQKILNKEKEELYKAWEIAWPKFKNGKITEDKFYSIFLKALNINDKEELIDTLKRVYRKNICLLEPFYLLENLKSKYKLYALTNIGKEALEYKIKRYNLEKFFGGIVASCLEGVAKPEKEIFDRLINRYSINPETSVFIDDLERNTEAAKKLGFFTIRYVDKKQLINDFKNLGINI